MEGPPGCRTHPLRSSRQLTTKRPLFRSEYPTTTTGPTTPPRATPATAPPSRPPNPPCPVAGADGTPPWRAPWPDCHRPRPRARAVRLDRAERHHQVRTGEVRPHPGRGDPLRRAAPPPAAKGTEADGGGHGRGPGAADRPQTPGHGLLLDPRPALRPGAGLDPAGRRPVVREGLDRRGRRARG